jgi:hypothetical protein
MNSTNSSVGVDVTELVYSQRVLLIDLTRVSTARDTFVRPFVVTASERETMRFDEKLNEHIHYGARTPRDGGPCGPAILAGMTPPISCQLALSRAAWQLWHSMAFHLSLFGTITFVRQSRDASALPSPNRRRQTLTSELESARHPTIFSVFPDWSWLSTGTLSYWHKTQALS